MQIAEKQSYTTTHLGLAAYLIAIGGQSAGTEHNGKQATFLFELTEKQLELVSKYDDGTGKVTALIYYNAYQMLKRKAYDE